MEISCSRCHNPIQEGICYCPTCGLPQLVYPADETPGQPGTEIRNEMRDADSVAWKPAMRTAMILAVPAGLLCSMFSPFAVLGFFLIAATASWVVLLYVRSQSAPWLTTGAGARIGLVTGILGGWIAAATTAITLFVSRFFLHNGKAWDDVWLAVVNQFQSQEQSTPGVDPQQIAKISAGMLSPEGRAGWMLFFLSIVVGVLLVSAVAGGAIGARLLARSRRPGI